MSHDKDGKNYTSFDERYDGCNPDPPFSYRSVGWSRLLRPALGVLLAFLLLLALLQRAGAQTPAVISGGAICDTLEEVRTLIRTDKPPDGCGALTQPVAAMVEVVDQFTHKEMVYTIGMYRMFIAGNMVIQYGIMKVGKKPLDA